MLQVASRVGCGATALDIHKISSNSSTQILALDMPMIKHSYVPPQTILRGMRVTLVAAQLLSLVGTTVIGITQPTPMSNLFGAPQVAYADVVPGGAPAANQIIGTVFQDFNSNGIRDTSGISGTTPAIDNGIGGVLVSVFAVGSALPITTNTSATGLYTVTGLTSGAAYRIEFSNLPANFVPAFHGSGVGSSSGTSVQFVTAGSSKVDFGINRPCDYCQDKPMIAATEQRANVTVSGLGGDATWPMMSVISYNVGLESPVPFYAPANNPDAPNNTAVIGSDYPATRPVTVGMNVIGTVWGLGYDLEGKRIFTSAYSKRFTNFSPNGTGAIFTEDPKTGATSLFADLNAIYGPGTAGPDLHKFSLQHDWQVTNTYPITNPWDAVGKTSFGDIDVSDDGSKLYAMNLYDRKVYELPTNQGVLNTPAAAAAIRSVSVPSTGLFTANGNCDAASVRPFATKYYQNKLYIGVVCSGETNPGTGDTFNVISSTWKDGSFNADNTAGEGFVDGNGDGEYTVKSRAKLHAYVLRADASTLAFEPTPVISFSLTGFRSATANIGGKVAFQAWVETPFAYRGTNYYSGRPRYAQAMLTDIDFDRDNMVLGIRDRLADQMGNNVYSMEGTGAISSTTTTPFESWSQGQLLRACGSTATGWTLENNGACGGITGFHVGANDLGPNGRFYHDTSGDQGRHATEGGLAVVPGAALISSVLDPAGWTNQGLRWYSNDSGVIKHSYNFYPTVITGGGNGSNGTGAFGKGASMGDVEALCDPAPIEIGNRVWVDLNADGVQGAGELPLSGINVTLTDALGRSITATTNAQGEYYFNGASGVSVALSSTVSGLNGSSPALPQISPNAAYTISINTTQLALANYVLTRQNGDSITSNDAVGDVRDSDAVQSGNLAVITLTTGGRGDNNHGYDFGFAAVATIGDRVWIDTNSNGVQDGAEITGVTGVRVWLLDVNSNSLFTTTTNGSGFYSFTNLISATYQVQFDLSTLPGAYSVTVQNANGNFSDTVDSDGNAITGLTAQTALDGGESDLTWDLGIVNVTPPTPTPTGTLPPSPSPTPSPTPTGTTPPTPTPTATPTGTTPVVTASLGNFVWEDLNGNGQQDVNEPGIVGVTVTLRTPTTTLTTVTGPGGIYAFNNLVPNVPYTVCFSVPVGYTFTLPNNGSDVTDSDPSIAQNSCATSVTLAPNAVNLTLDAGLVRPASLGDYVWLDVNRNGTQDPGEQVVAGVTVTLYAGGVPIATQVTNVSGNYRFDNLVTGTPYTLSFTQPPGLAWTTTGPIATSPNDSNANGQGVTSAPVILTSGEHNPTIDAGLASPLLLDKQAVTSGPNNTVGIDNIVTYTIRVTNTSNVVMVNVVVTDPLPSNLSYVVGSANPPPSQTNPLVWRYNAVLPGQSKLITFQANVLPNASTQLTNVAYLAGGPISGIVASDDASAVSTPTSVVLANLAAQRQSDGVHVLWMTTLEQDTFGFHLLRAEGSDRAMAVRLTTDVLPAQGRNGGASYDFVDTSALTGKTYTYWLQETEVSGALHEYGPVTLGHITAVAPALSSSPSPQSAPGGVVVVLQPKSELPQAAPGTIQAEVIAQTGSIQKVIVEPANIDVITGDKRSDILTKDVDHGSTAIDNADVTTSKFTQQAAPTTVLLGETVPAPSLVQVAPDQPSHKQEPVLTGAFVQVAPATQGMAVRVTHGNVEQQLSKPSLTSIETTKTTNTTNTRGKTTSMFDPITTFVLFLAYLGILFLIGLGIAIYVKKRNH